MASISASLESQQTPSPITLNWCSGQGRATLALEGSSPADLDFRFKLNAVFRSTRNATSKSAVLRRSEKGKLMYNSTRRVPRAEFTSALDVVLDDKLSVRGVIRSLYTKAGRPVPSKYQDSPAPASEDDTIFVPSPTFSKGVPLQQIMAEEKFSKEIANKRENLIALERLHKLFAWTLDEADRVRKKQVGDIGKDKNLTDDEKAEKISALGDDVPLPRLVEPVEGLTVEYFSSRDIIEQDYAQLAAFIDRNKVRPLWYAPQQAFDVEKGLPLPLSKEAESWLLKNQSKKTKPLARLSVFEREWVAWRWLIISHNHVFPDSRVPLTPKLSARYDRKVVAGQSSGQSKHAQVDPGLLMELRDAIASLSTKAAEADVTQTVERQYNESTVNAIVESLTGLVIQFTSNYAAYSREVGNFQPKVGADGTPKEFHKKAAASINATLDHVKNLKVTNVVSPTVVKESPDLSELLSAFSKIEAPPGDTGKQPAASVEDEEDWDAAYPETFEEQGRVWYREDIDIVGVPGTIVLSQSRGGVTYSALADKEQPTELSAQGKKAGEGSSKKKEKPRPKALVSLPPKSPTPATVTDAVPGKKVTPVEEENPLRVKGVPKSQSLSDDQRKALRTYFKCEEGMVDPSTWASLGAKEKSRALKARSIPRWATEAVLRNPSSLEMILRGELTVDNMAKAARVAPIKEGGKVAQAMEAWQALKHDFKGTALLKRPDTGKEKAFRKRFDNLVSEYGQQSCFPKLKERPDQQGRPNSSSKGGRSSNGGMEQFVDIARAFGEIARAFQGK